MMAAPFSHLHDCSYNHYCLQFSDYKNMIELNTSIKIDATYTIWLGDKNENQIDLHKNKESYKLIKRKARKTGTFFKVYKCEDYSKELLEVYEQLTLVDDDRFKNKLKIKRILK